MYNIKQSKDPSKPRQTHLQNTTRAKKNLLLKKKQRFAKSGVSQFAVQDISQNPRNIQLTEDR